MKSAEFEARLCEPAEFLSLPSSVVRFDANFPPVSLTTELDVGSTELGGNVDNRERVPALGRYSKALAGARLPQRGGAGPEASPAGPGPRLTPARRPWA